MATALWWPRLFAVGWQASPGECWDTCRRTGFFCEVFCCQPLDGVGNPSCWDPHGYFTYERCCLVPAVQALVEPPEPERPLAIQIGDASIPLYRGPATYNSPKTNERTVEVALGLWFMRRCIATLHSTNGGFAPVEVGNVLASYWPREERMWGYVMPWQVFDLGHNGQDATQATFVNATVLSLSTVEHIGYDNQGADRVEGFHVGMDEAGLEAWVRSWDAGPALLARIAREATEFLVTFPVGFNPHLDTVVARTPWLRRMARVLRRVDAANRWEVDPEARFDYKYDYRDTYDSEYVGYVYHPRLPEVYKRAFGQRLVSAPVPLPAHPPFRFANAICMVTNVPELLA